LAKAIPQVTGREALVGNARRMQKQRQPNQRRDENGITPQARPILESLDQSLIMLR